MLFQHASELAIRATVFLAQQAPGKLSPVHEIAAHAGVSEAYLAKILQKLAGAGLVRSFRGPGKGMELGRAASTITLASLILVMEGSKGVDECVLGLGTCSEETPCVLHDEWIPIHTKIRNLLEKTTLADLVQSVITREAKFGARQASELRATAKAETSRERRHQ
jgi:Rrf2 family transcriptional regulator, iron-sulfur cluster assembly transcription factor